MRDGLLLPLVRYLTNRVIAKIPVFALRHAWYRRVLGMRIGAGTTLLMDQYIYVRGRAQATSPWEEEFRRFFGDQDYFRRISSDDIP